MRASLFSRTVLVGVLTGSLGLGACVPDAIVPNPRLDVPDRYRYSDARGGLEDHAVDWWVTFRQPELTRFEEEAEVANLSVAAAIGQIEQADAAARINGSALFPLISASNTISRNGSGGGSSAGTLVSAASATGTGTGTGTTGTNGLGGTSSASVLTASDRSNLVSSFGATYQLDIWGKNRAAYVASQDNATASRWNRQTVQLTQLASIATTYFNVLAARERVKFARRNVSDSSRILKLIEDREKAGTATALDVAQQAALVANLRASIPPLEVTAEQNVIALGILLGRTPQRITVSATSVLDNFVPRPAPGIPSEVLTQRPDVEYAESSLSAAHANLVSARAAFFPQLNLTAQGGFSSTALTTLFTPSSFFYSAALGVTQPIFDAGLLRGQFDEQKGIQDQLLAQYKLAVITAFSDVDRALVGVRRYAEQEALTRQSLAASRKAFDLSEQRLQGGVLDVVSLLQVEQTLFTTQDALVQVRLLRLIQAIALYQALGGAYAPSAKGRRAT